MTVHGSTREIEFQCSETDSLLRGRLIFPDGGHQPTPVLVMLTGDGPKGTKSLSWSNLPARFAARGFASFLFDFAGLGLSEGDRRGLTITAGMANLRSAMTVLLEQAGVSHSNLYALGSSFGANALLLQPELANHFRAIGLKSPACFLPDAYLNECATESFETWTTKGYNEELGYRVEVLLDGLRYNAYAAARRINRPCLITHGSADQIVPLRQSQYLSASLRGKTTLKIFQGVGHGYSEPGAWEAMAELFIDWFSGQLKEELD